MRYLATALAPQIRVNAISPVGSGAINLRYFNTGMWPARPWLAWPKRKT